MVGELVKSDIAKALGIARKIDDGWYRCQSLAQVAYSMGGSKAEFLKIAREALKAAAETKQPNRIVSASSWIIWVMAKRVGLRDKEIIEMVEEMLERIRKEPNPVRRADALFFLFEAIYSREKIRPSVLEPLLKSCQEMNSWKAPRMLGNIALVLALDEPDLAESVIIMLGKPSDKENLRRQIEANHYLGPNDFLPHFTKSTSNANR